MKGRNCHFTKYGGGEYRARVFGGSTQIRYGGGGTAVMTSVRLEMWKLPLYTSQRWATDGDTNLTITAKYQTTHKKRLFRKSNLESVYQAALNGWLSRGGGRGVDSTITRSHSKRQWQPRLSRINVWNSPGKAFNAGISFLLRLKSVHLKGFNMVEAKPQCISDCWRTNIMKFSSGATNT